ncbi:hypothetical protein DEO72_LG6g871 [Vigna unguiculata]|uniref:Uncharacterized protein n=1 Tax=Vigna unguiculata TaxID=3917 RepID=A0A4D6M4C3_VIGUN|nr:hypothetical protein DEO72_LG6g871 [Vigna unguiculata]
MGRRRLVFPIGGVVGETLDWKRVLHCFSYSRLPLPAGYKCWNFTVPPGLPPSNVEQPPSYAATSTFIVDPENVTLWHQRVPIILKPHLTLTGNSSLRHSNLHPTQQHQSSSLTRAM